jgi:hypothetical protein
MITKSKIALYLALALSTGSVSLATASEDYDAHERSLGYAMSFPEAGVERAQVNRPHIMESILGTRPRREDAPGRWIDNPASPGG